MPRFQVSLQPVCYCCHNADTLATAVNFRPSTSEFAEKQRFFASRIQWDLGRALDIQFQKEGQFVFRCQMCGKVSGAGTKSTKVTVASREREYKGNIEDFPQRRFGRFREPRKPRDRGGKGHEIVKELMVCKTCGESHQQKQAAAQEAAAKAAAEAALIETPVSTVEE